MKHVDSINRKVPILFSDIIELDKHISDVSSKGVISRIDVMSFQDLKKRRRELTVAAEKYVQRQKGL